MAVASGLSILNDPKLAIKLGMIEGADLITKFAQRIGTTTTFQTIWNGPDLIYQGFLDHGVAGTIDIVSDNIADNLVTNPDLTYFVQGLDVNYDPQTDVVPAHPTDGRLAVTTLKSFSRVYKTRVVKSSDRTLVNVGDVTFTSNSASNPAMSFMSAGEGASQQGMISIADGKFALFSITTVGVDANKNARIRVKASEIVLGNTSPFTIEREMSFQGGPRSLPSLFGVNGPMDIVIEGALEVGTGDIFFEAEIIVFDKASLGDLGISTPVL